MKGRLAALFMIACCLAAGRATAEEPNETFEQVASLPPGALTTGPQSMSDGGLGITYADTTLGFYNNTSFDILVRRNSNHVTAGDGRGSAITNYPVNRDGSVPLAVSGYRDLDFDGLNDGTSQPHMQSGNVELTLRIWDTEPTPDPVAVEVREFALAPGEVTFFDFADESWIGHTFTAIVDNSIDAGNDVDFWRFTGLTPGATFSTRTDTTISPPGLISRLYDGATGEVLLESINAQEGCPLGLCGTVDENGEVVLAITGYDDFEFIGAHGVLGDYTLNLVYDGDADRDGDVDGDDLMNLLLGLGTPFGAPASIGDFDYDDDVDRDDLAIWQRNAGAGTLTLLGTSQPPNMLGQPAGVPEPGTFILFTTGLAAFGLAPVYCRRHHS